MTTCKQCAGPLPPPDARKGRRANLTYCSDSCRLTHQKRLFKLGKGQGMHNHYDYPKRCRYCGTNGDHYCPNDIGTE